MSCGNHVTLLAYPEYRTLLSVPMTSPIWGAAFLSPHTITIGSRSGFGAVLPLSSANNTHGNDVTTWRGANVFHCHGRSTVFSVKSLLGLSSDLFYTSSADRTVRLHDARALCTCTPEDDTCNSHVVLRGLTSLTSLSVNPANPYQFCVSHSNSVGIHDVRMSCSHTSHFLDRFDIPPPPSRYYSGARNRVTDTVFSGSGAEILVNTRTVGILLVSTKSHEQIENFGNVGGDCSESWCHSDIASDFDHHDNGSNTQDRQREQFVVCEDSSGVGTSPLVDSGEAAAHLGRILSTRLNAKSGHDQHERIPLEEDEEDGTRRGIVTRYTGHRNIRTALKEAAFWGDKLILSGSDCGRLFVWDKESGKVLTALSPHLTSNTTTNSADTTPDTTPPTTPPHSVSEVLLSVQPHPTLQPVVATCGLQGVVRVWEPSLKQKDDMEDVESILSENRRVLRQNEGVIPVPQSVIMRALSDVDPGNLLNRLL